VGLDAAGNVYIADTLNHRIRVVDGNGRISSIVGVCGAISGFRGDGGLAPTAQLNSPFGMYVDGAGEIYVADVNNNRIRAGYGLTGAQRTPTCPGPASTASPRGAANGTGAASGPGPRFVDQGGRPSFSTVAGPATGHASAAPRGAQVINWKTTTPPAAPGFHAKAREAPPAVAPSVGEPAAGRPSAIAVGVPRAKSPQLQPRPATPLPNVLAICLALGVPLVLVAVVAARRHRARRRGSNRHADVTDQLLPQGRLAISARGRRGGQDPRVNGRIQ
jgi:hypothetical protein